MRFLKFKRKLGFLLYRFLFYTNKKNYCLAYNLHTSYQNNYSNLKDLLVFNRRFDDEDQNNTRRRNRSRTEGNRRRNPNRTEANRGSKNEIKSPIKFNLARDIRNIVKLRTQKTNISAEKIAKEKIKQQLAVSEYINTTKDSKPSYQVIIISIMIFTFATYLFIISNFLNTNNPIEKALSSMRSSASLNIIDEKNNLFFLMNKNSSNFVYANEISSNFINTFINFHSLNELVYQSTKETTDKLVTNDNVSSLVQNYSNYINNPEDSLGVKIKRMLYTVAIEIISIPKYVAQATSFLWTEDITSNIIKDNLEKVADLEEKKNEIYYKINGCNIFKNVHDLTDTDCKYSYINIIIDNIYTSKSLNSSSIDTYLNPIKKYLLINWLKEKISFKEFFVLFLNNTYFGNYEIGLKPSYEKYFTNENNTNSMDIPSSLYMILKMYENNKNYYSNYEINAENILDMMIINEYIPVDLKQPILERFKQLKKADSNHLNSMSILLDNIINTSYSNLLNFNQVNINTTISITLHNTLVNLLTITMNDNNIPSGSFIVLKNNNIVTSTSFDIENNEIMYNKSYPEVSSYNNIKPFMYLALLSKQQDIPIQLLRSEYQNLIFANNINKNRYSNDLTSNPNFTIDDITTDLQEKDLYNIEIFNEARLDEAPENIEPLFAEQLANIDYKFLTSITMNDYKDIFHQLKITNNNWSSISINDILKGDLKLNLYTISRAYSTFLKIPYISEPKIINDINGIYDTSLLSKRLISINNNYIDTLKQFYFNKITTENGLDFYVMMDLQTVIFFNEEYVVSFWLGDSLNREKYKNTTRELEQIVEKAIPIISSIE